jgi:kinesin family protein C2/C3
VLRLLDEGQKNRATSATLMNAGSSRSHALLLVNILQRDTTTMRTRRGKLCT